MTEVYHPQLESNNLQLPRILGMTASPINTKGSSDNTGYWKQIHELENLMNSKVFTCSSEFVKAEYLAVSTPKLKCYTHVDIPYSLSEKMDSELKTLKEKFECDIEKANVEKPQKDSTRQRLSKLCSTFFFCLRELGLWLAIQVLEAITTKKCQEKFDLESLEALGDSFLKYAACQQGLIRNEPFDPKMWIIPGYQMEAFHEVQLSTGTKVFTKGTRKIRSKVVADVVEALIGVFLSCGGEAAALSFMNWLGIEVDFRNVPYQRSFQAHPKELLNISYLESLLKYSFTDATLLVEALTHGSFMLPQIPQCYQVLGDIIESLAGAIFVDCGYNKDIVFKSILPLLEPLVSPATLKLQPVRELHQLCQKENYVLKKPVVSCEDGVAAVTIEVEASGIIYKESCTAPNKAEAEKLASKAILKSLKESMSTEPHPIPFLSSPKGKNRKKKEQAMVTLYLKDNKNDSIILM